MKRRNIITMSIFILRDHDISHPQSAFIEIFDQIARVQVAQHIVDKLRLRLRQAKTRAKPTLKLNDQMSENCS
jgi:hypothetical protein